MVAISDGAGRLLPVQKGSKPVYIVLQLEGGIVQWLWVKTRVREAVEQAERMRTEGNFNPEDDEILIVEAIPDEEEMNIIWAWPNNG